MMAMAGDGCEGSVAASSSPTGNWWTTTMPEVHGTPLCNWSHCDQLPWRPASAVANDRRRRAVDHPSFSSSCDGQQIMSTTNPFVTNACSDRSGLGLESQEVMVQSGSHVDLSLEPTAPDAHIWNQVFPGVGSNGELPNNQVDRDKLLAAFSSKALRPEIFDPPPDHFRKPESNWEFTNYSGGFDNEKLNFLVNNWSSAPVDSQVTQDLADESASSCTTLTSALNLYRESNLTQFDLRREIKQDNVSSSSFSNGGSGAGNSINPAGYPPCFRIHTKEGKQIEASNTPFQASKCGSVGNQLSLSGAGTGCRPWCSTKKVADVIHFSGALNKPLLDFQTSKMHIKGAELQNCKETVHETFLTSRGNGRGEATTCDERKKKKMEVGSQTVLKKQKHEGSTVSSSKLQVPKMKIGDRITALQQIVAPFGKTDTASVLLEAITYIKFMQEQVLLLLNHPYMKPNPAKQEDHNLWGGAGKKGNGSEANLDLRSRGLCLVPISCTPQVYRESTGVDSYWTPSYRGCLYR